MENAAGPKNTNVARPYALAAFETAREKRQLSEWKAFLISAANITRDKSLQQLLLNPEITSDKFYTLYEEILSPMLNTERKNFLLLLSQNKRLSVLPDIAAMFNNYYANFEKISSVRVVTAIDIEEGYKQKLTQALTKRVHHDVIIHCEVDPAILGGAIIHIGDRVIDGSIRGKLTRLLQNLTD